MRGIPTLILIIIMIIVWQILHVMLGSGVITSPYQTVTHLIKMLSEPMLWENIAVTAKAFIYSFIIALTSGLVLGVLLGLNKISGNVAEPILMNLYAIPKVTLYPLVLLCFGLGMPSKVAFGVMHGLIPIMLFTMNAVRQIPPVYLRTAQVSRLSPLQSACYIIMPAIMPEVLSGVRLGFSLTLLGVLIGEMFASQHGLGYLAMNAMGTGDISTILSIALLLTIVSVSCNALMIFLQKTIKHA